MANEIPVIPPDMRKVYLRLKRWRSSHARRVPIPESLWAAAGELARAHGINPTAKALHLEYGKLKQRAEGAAPAVKRRVAKATADAPRRAGRAASRETGNRSTVTPSIFSRPSSIPNAIGAPVIGRPTGW
jgi:hypothetical protein